MNELEERWRAREREETSKAPDAPTTSNDPVASPAEPARADVRSGAANLDVAPARRGERLRLLLAFLVGGLFATAVFLIVELVRKNPAPGTAGPVAVASDTGKPADSGASNPNAAPGAAPQPADPFGQLFQQMAKGMGRALQGFGSGGPGGGFTLRFGSDDIALDVQDAGDAVVVVAKVQGAIEGKIDIRVEGTMFTLSGERRLGTHGTMSFTKSISLPAQVDVGKMTQSLKDGVLTVRLPKN